MAANKGEIAKEVLAFILGASMGGGRAGSSMAANLLASAARGGSTGSGTSVPGVPGLSGVAQQFLAKQYPDQFAPQAWHTYDVVNIPGAANFNQHGKANAGVIDEAGVMQDIDLHNRTITKYIRPGMTPQQERLALQQGLQEEKNLPQFWNESSSRRPFSVSSSAVSGIRLTPDARVEVQWKSSPKWYTFRAYPNTYEASLAAQELLKADSIGRAVYPVVSRPLKSPNPLLGGWNKKNYDASYA